MAKIVDKTAPELSEYDWYKSRWDPQKYPKFDHPVTAQKLAAELRYLAELMGPFGADGFAKALRDLEVFQLIGPDGDWRTDWTMGNPDPVEGLYALAAERVSWRVACDPNERLAIAAEVVEQQLPAANFDAAWARLRATYHQTHPERPKSNRGRPKKPQGV